MRAKLIDATIGDLCQVFDGPHATPTRLDAGPVFLGITSLNKGRIDLSASDHVSEEDFAKWTRRVTPKPGDVVFSYETKLGEVAIIPEGLRCCLGRRMGLMRPNPDKLDGRFLLYYYLGPEFQDVIRARTIPGSTVERIALIEFPKFPLRIPPLVEQKRIAEILGALDDKIELNRRMNATLEAMARALFQSWFVDFDPVRAKASGSVPAGLDPAIAALFPDSFLDSPLGPIPNGWTAAVVEDILRISRESLDPGSSPDECFEHFSLPAYDAGQRPAHDMGGDIKSLKFVVPVDCVLVSKLNPRTPRVWIPSAKGKLRQVASTEFLVCIGDKSKSISREFIFCLSRSDACLEHLGAHSGGTSNSHQRVRPQDFLDYRFPKAPVALLEAFTAKTKPIFDQIEVLRAQSITLAVLRDSLLPKLLSGEFCTN